MPKIIPLKYREVCKKLKKLWYEWPKAGWNHMYMYKGTQVLPIPNHGWKDVSRWVLKVVITSVNISVEERNKL